MGAGMISVFGYGKKKRKDEEPLVPASAGTPTASPESPKPPLERKPPSRPLLMDEIEKVVPPPTPTTSGPASIPDAHANRVLLPAAPQVIYDRMPPTPQVPGPVVATQDQLIQRANPVSPLTSVGTPGVPLRPFDVPRQPSGPPPLMPAGSGPMAQPGAAGVPADPRTGDPRFAGDPYAPGSATQQAVDRHNPPRFLTPDARARMALRRQSVADTQSILPNSPTAFATQDTADLRDRMDMVDAVGRGQARILPNQTAVSGVEGDPTRFGPALQPGQIPGRVGGLAQTGVSGPLEGFNRNTPSPMAAYDHRLRQIDAAISQLDNSPQTPESEQQRAELHNQRAAALQEGQAASQQFAQEREQRAQQVKNEITQAHMAGRTVAEQRRMTEADERRREQEQTTLRMIAMQARLGKPDGQGLQPRDLINAGNRRLEILQADTAQLRDESQKLHDRINSLDPTKDADERSRLEQELQQRQQRAQQLQQQTTMVEGLVNQMFRQFGNPADAAGATSQEEEKQAAQAQESIDSFQTTVLGMANRLPGMNISLPAPGTTFPNPTPQAQGLLRANRKDPKAIAEYDEIYGPGAAQRVLGAS